MIKLSIIIPVYNGQEYIVQCLESIAKQTFNDYEIIIINDGSTDNTEELILSFFDEHHDISYKLINQNNCGSSVARKVGISEARGEYIGFVDGDDYIEDNYYEKMMNALNSNQYDIVCAGIIQHIDKKIIKLPDSMGLNHDDFSIDDIKLMLLNHQAYYQYLFNKVYRRSLFLDIDYKEESFIGEDFILNMDILDKNPRIIFIDNYGYHYCPRNSSQTEQGYNETHRNMYYIFKEYYQKTIIDNKEIKEALERYIILHYMYILVTMTRNNKHDSDVEKGVLEFVRLHKDNYLKYSTDGIKAKIAVKTALLNYDLFKIITKMVDKK